MVKGQSKDVRPSRVQLVNEHIARVVDGIGNTIDPVLSESPVAGVDTVANSREDGRIVSGPQFRPEDDMAELGAVGDLLIVLAGGLVMKRR